MRWHPHAWISRNADPEPRLARSNDCSFESVYAEAVRALVGGLQIMISKVDRNATAPPNDPPEPAGSHYLRLDVSFLAVTGTHTVYDPHAAMPIVIDEAGPNAVTNSAPGVSVSYKMANPDNFCGPAPTPSAIAGGGLGGNIAPPLAVLGPGQHVGPVHMCFWVKGSVNQQLTYAWWPSIIPDTPGTLYKPVMIPLPWPQMRLCPSIGRARGLA